MGNRDTFSDWPHYTLPTDFLLSFPIHKQFEEDSGNRKVGESVR